MGRKVWGTCYTDCSDTAGWRATEGLNSPWSVEPEFAKLQPFCLRMLAVDWMHCWHLGVARDLIGSGIKILASKRDEWYAETSILKRLSKIYQEVKQYARSAGKQISIKHLKKSTVKWRKRDCPELRASASDSGVFLAWLAQKLEAEPPVGPYAGLLGCVWVAHKLCELMMCCDVFWNREEQEQVELLGACFLRSYGQLAFVAHARNEKLFKIRPKYHYIAHLCEDATRRPSSRAAGWDMCWWDEDYIKYAMRMYRRVNPRTAQEHMLRRNLVQVKECLARYA